MGTSTQKQRQVPHIFLTDQESYQIRLLLREIAGQYGSAEDADFLDNARIFAHELPRRLRILLNNFKLTEQPYGGFVLSGYPIDDARIGKTPAHWNLRIPNAPGLEEEFLLIMLGALLGEPFAFATQQDGHIIHDVLPIKEHENEQLGSGCKQTLEWHTEDAFHPYRADYVVLMCLRNSQRVATTFASIDRVCLSSAHIDILFEERFVIRPDNSHLMKNNSALKALTPSKDNVFSAFSRIEQMHERPEKIAILFADRQAPYLRIDPYFMDPPAGDNMAQEALDHLIRALDDTLIDVVLQPGDFLFLDNYRAVHGRRPFCANYDGEDRWLKRINVTTDLRKSRGAQLSGRFRVLM